MPETPGKTESLTVDDWISLNDAARLLGESRQTVLSRAIKGDVVAQHIAGRTVVSRTSIEQYKARVAATEADSVP